MAEKSGSGYWPHIDSTEKAIEVMHHGSIAAVITTVLTAAIGITAICLHHPVLGADGSTLVDATFFAVVAWRVYRLSLPWAVTGLIVFTTGKIYDFLASPRTAGIILAVIFFLYYLHAVRGGLYLRRERNAFTAASPTEVT